MVSDCYMLEPFNSTVFLFLEPNSIDSVEAIVGPYKQQRNKCSKIMGSTAHREMGFYYVRNVIFKPFV